MEYFFELFLSGLTRGSIYALIALGYTMVYGIIELINFAHGEIYMIGAFTALIVASVRTVMGLNQFASLLLASIAAAVYAAAYGYTVEKIAYKPLRHAPRLSPLISAIGMSIFLQNYVLLAQTSDFLPFPSLIPEFEFWEPYSHILRYMQLVILLSTTVIMMLLMVLIKYTRIGKAMRATAQDRSMAMLVGVNVNQVNFHDICHRLLPGSGWRRFDRIPHRTDQFFHWIYCRNQGIYRSCSGRCRQHSRRGAGQSDSWPDRKLCNRLCVQ